MYVYIIRVHTYGSRKEQAEHAMSLLFYGGKVNNTFMTSLLPIIEHVNCMHVNCELVHSWRLVEHLVSYYATIMVAD